MPEGYGRVYWTRGWRSATIAVGNWTIRPGTAGRGPPPGGPGPGAALWRRCALSLGWLRAPAFLGVAAGAGWCSASAADGVTPPRAAVMRVHALVRPRRRVSGDGNGQEGRSSDAASCVADGRHAGRVRR